MKVRDFEFGFLSKAEVPRAKPKFPEQSRSSQSKAEGNFDTQSTQRGYFIISKLRWIKAVSSSPFSSDCDKRAKSSDCFIRRSCFFLVFVSKI